MNEGGVLKEKKSDSANTSKEESGTTHSLKHFVLSCFHVCATLFCPSLFYLPHLFPQCLLILVFSCRLLSSSALLLHLRCSSLVLLDLYKSERRRRGGGGGGGVGVTMAYTHCLICLDHGYGAYLDNKAACQHLPSHSLPHSHGPALESE